MQWHEFRTHIRHLPAKDLNRLERAFALGKKLHGDQKRFSGDPYFNHPIAVAMMLSDLGADADTLIASLLHDTVEDTPISVAEIDHQFDGSVGKLIDGLTKLSSEDVAASPNLNEQVETLRKIFTLMQSDIRIMVIKLIDRLHNMQTIEFLPPERQRLLTEETAEVFVKIADRLCMRDIRDELDALCLSILEPEVYERLKEIRLSNEQNGIPIVEKIRKNFRSFDSQLAAHTKISFANKSWEQLRLQYEAPAAIGTSFITVIFICDDVDGCYRTLGVLHQMWKREILSFEDFVNVPQLNGYRGIHTTIIAPDGTRVRCKIRTREMQEYSRLGVSSVCFKGPTNIGEILPWTKRISPLAVDTEGSSNDFWQNLKSDILGEAITVHGPDDTTVQLPKNATALDGVFHLFQENALRTKAIRVNGQEVPLNTILARGVSLDLELADEETCNLEWLHSVNTGFATAKIRTFLSQQSEDKKLETGKNLLQRVLSDHKKGYIEEFDQKKMLSKLERLGYSSFEQAFVAIADGHLSPRELAAVILNEPDNAGPKSVISRKRYSVKLEIPKVSKEALRRLADLYGTYGNQIENIHFIPQPNTNTLGLTIVVSMTPAELAVFQDTISLFSPAPAVTTQRSVTAPLLLATVILFWAINPVLAKWFLFHGMSVLNLVTVRLITFSVLTSLLYIVWRIFFAPTYARIPNGLLLALPSTISLVLLTVFTYWALETMPPSIHLTILRFNVLLLPVSYFIRHRTLKIRPFIFLTLTLLCGLCVLLVFQPAVPKTGLLISILALVSYVSYSLLTEQTLHTHKIDIRYPVLLFQSGLMLGVVGLFLIPFQPWNQLFSPVSALSILYVFFCVFVPHACFNAVLNKMKFRYITDVFLAEVPIAMFFENALLGIALPASIYFLVAAIICTILLLRWRTVQMMVMEA